MDGLRGRVSTWPRGALREETMEKTKLEGPECPVCRGWNCTPESPHAAWVKGTPQNELVRKGKEKAR